jgi:Ser/Thr protein kinase RdoA (MazF antagonist)
MDEVLIGQGRHADVYDIGDGLVLRRYRQDRDTSVQALAMQAARQAGYPVPGRVESSGREIVMERIGGSTMLQAIARAPWQLHHYAAVLAELHDRLHAVPAPDGFPHPLGDGGALLHLDLQPENILIDPERGPVVLDWEWAAAGPASADVAHTWLQLATSEIPGSTWRRLVGAAGAKTFLRAFLTRVDRPSAAAAMGTVRQYRLAQRELTAKERRAITAFVLPKAT